MKNVLHIDIGRRIEDRRRTLSLTREELAIRTIPPMSSKYLWEVETGRKHLSAEMLRRLAIALDVTTDWLLYLPENMM